MKDVQRVAIVDPSDSTREPLRNLLLGVESVWLEAECSRYEFFIDVARQSHPDIVVVALDADHTDVAGSLNNLALIQRILGHLDQAQQLLQRAVDIYEKAPGPEQPELARGLFNLGLVYRARGDPVRAEAEYQRAVAIMEKTLGPEHRSVAQVLNQLANIFLNQGQLEQAEQLQQRALRSSLVSLTESASIYKNRECTVKSICNRLKRSAFLYRPRNSFCANRLRQAVAHVK